MQHKIKTDGFTILYDETFWRLEKDFDLRSTLNMGYDFEAILGDNAIHYKPSFGVDRRLPGQLLAVRNIESVLVGYQKDGFWVLGLHLKQNEVEKPVFRPLTKWKPAPLEQDREAALQAARGLASILGMPLKIYGDKKTPDPSADTTRSGVTGPLDPHLRRKISAEAVSEYLRTKSLPINGDGFTLAESRTGLALKLGKTTTRGKIEAPLFNLCEINTKDKAIKLLAATGLLSSFLGDRGREIPFSAIFNIEYRVVQTQLIQKIKAEGGGYAEEITPVHLWGIYLTLKDESLLLLQASYTVSLKLKQAKSALVGSTKLETNSAEGLKYFNEQLAEEHAIEQFHLQTEATAYFLASTLGKHLVVTEVKG